MTIFPEEMRDSLARRIRFDRKNERGVFMKDPRMNTKRDRPAFMYLEHLQGLVGTLDYIRSLSSPVLVDLGAGTSRAAADLAKSSYGDAISFIGTGLVWDSAIREHLGVKLYRLTPAELMREFAPASVGGFLSVYGPFYYSSFLSQVVARVDELLVPGGVIKTCSMRYVPSSKPETNEAHAKNCARVEEAFRLHGYGCAWMDHDIQNPKTGLYRTLPGSNRILLAVKPAACQNGLTEAKEIARRLLETDSMNVIEMKKAFVEPT